MSAELLPCRYWPLVAALTMRGQADYYDLDPVLHQAKATTDDFDHLADCGYAEHHPQWSHMVRLTGKGRIWFDGDLYPKFVRVVGSAPSTFNGRRGMPLTSVCSWTCYPIGDVRDASERLEAQKVVKLSPPVGPFEEEVRVRLTRLGHTYYRHINS